MRDELVMTISQIFDETCPVNRLGFLFPIDPAVPCMADQNTATFFVISRDSKFATGAKISSNGTGHERNS